MGNIDAGIRNSASRSLSQLPEERLKSMVREALLASVICRRPPVNFQSSQVSTVPNARRFASASSRALGT